jgi:uncharacterized repeat protein (TIGR01451 family)
VQPWLLKKTFRFSTIIWGIWLLLPGSAAAQTFNTPGAWTYTVPAGVSSVQVQVSGAGGGGGGADTGAGGAGSNGALVTAVISVTPGQVLSGTIGTGGLTGYTSGAASFGFGAPCTGNGAGGAGVGTGGNGGAANCPGNGYSGGGGGGGGGTTFAVAGTVFVQAGGGGGGGGGGNGPVGGNGTTNLTLTSSATCGTSVNGTSATPFNGDGGGGGGGGGGFTAGTAGVSNSDAVAATGGGGGGSCRRTSALVLYNAISAAGSAGAAGRTAPIGIVGPRGTAGSVVITLSGISVQKTSSTVSDQISASNPKSMPGSTIRYCILISNIWAATATNVILADPLPSQTTYVASTLSSGTTCANATTIPAAGASITGSTINATIASLAPGASYALTFNVTVN